MASISRMMLGTMAASTVNGGSGSTDKGSHLVDLVEVIMAEETGELVPSEDYSGRARRRWWLHRWWLRFNRGGDGRGKG